MYDLKEITSPHPPMADTTITGTFIAMIVAINAVEKSL